MALNKNQKEFILKNRKKFSAKKLAAELNVTIDDVNNFLKNNPLPKTPKIFYLFLILIPISFFVLLEVGLRTFDYGYDTRTWITISGDRYGLNPDFAHRYFYNVERMPESIQDVFKIEKPANGFRVFILGGSSAAGYPFMPFGSFSRYVRQRLEIAYPGAEIEVFNGALTAVNTYTVRDLVPDILEAEPDLILIYTGHNEYYGALGVGSLESLGRSRLVVNTLLALRQYKTLELLRNFLTSVMGVFANSSEAEEGTLMSRMAQEKSIPFGSDIYQVGIDQFEGNLRDIIEKIKEKNVPVIISTLASNLVQPPFISEAAENFLPADSVYSKAEKTISTGDYDTADSLYRFAKDLDMLRFRAPEELNNIIYKLCDDFNVPYIDVDFYFAEISPNNITGNNLMVDHLHPTLQGYQLMGKLFYEKMSAMNYLPQLPIAVPYSLQDSVTLQRYVFSELDSVIADFKIKILKNDWPFVEKSQKVLTSSLITTNNFIDSTAMEFIYGEEEWERAQRRVAVWHLKRKEYSKFISQMELLINQYPFIPDYYNMISTELLRVGKYNEVYDFLRRRYKIKPDKFSTKWLGIIELYWENVDLAEKYLLEFIKYGVNDSQVLYNLAGVYVKRKDYKKALITVNSSLDIKPDYQNAIQLQAQLKAALGYR